LAAPSKGPLEQPTAFRASKVAAAGHQSQQKITASKTKRQGNYRTLKSSQPTTSSTSQGKADEKVNRRINTKRQLPGDSSQEGKDIIAKY
jgi:hypothetical protein